MLTGEEPTVSDNAIVRPAPGQTDAERLPSLAAPWNLSLREAVEITLRNNKAIAVSSYTPQIQDTAVDAEISAFDPEIGLNLQGSKLDQQLPGPLFLGFISPSSNQQIDSLRNSDDAVEDNIVYFTQGLYTGGRFTLGLGTDYNNFFPTSPTLAVNPIWDSELKLNFAQPLFRGRGQQVNTAFIAIENLDRDRDEHIFREEVNGILRDTLLAYWSIGIGQLRVDALRSVTRMSAETLQREKEQMEIGRSALPDVTEAENRYLRYAVDFGAAKKRLRTARTEARRLLGIPQNENGILVIDVEQIGQDVPVDWEQGVVTARTRPALLARLQSIRAARIGLAYNENRLLPDLRLEGEYNIRGLEDRLDDSLQTIGDNRFNYWELGLSYRRALGQREENASARRATLELRQQEAELINQEHNILASAHAAYQRVLDCKNLLKLSRRRTEVARRYVFETRQLYEAERTTLFAQLDAEERYSEAALSEVDNLSDYRRAVTDWLFVTGLIADEFIVFDSQEP